MAVNSELQEEMMENTAMDAADELLENVDEDVPAPTPEVATIEEDDLQSVPVALEISLPSMKIPLETVKSLSQGATLPLGVDLSEAMVIGINGQPFGTGHFVQIGDKVGIQIETWKSGKTH